MIAGTSILSLRHNKCLTPGYVRRTISLWTTQKKKPIFTQAVAHGIDESHVHTEDVEIVRKPRWITALGCLRYSDLFASGMVLHILTTRMTLTLKRDRILGRRDTAVEA